MSSFSFEKRIEKLNKYIPSIPQIINSYITGFLKTTHQDSIWR